MNPRWKENNATYKRLRAEIDRRFPKGRFVAVDGGKIVADAATFDDIDRLLDDMGLTSPDVLVVQAQSDLPEYVTIFI